MARTPSPARDSPALSGTRGVFYATGTTVAASMGARLGLVGDQLAQERNQRDERNTDHETSSAELREELRVPSICGDRRGTGRLGDHSRKVTCKQ